MAVTHVMAVELDGKPLGVPMDLVVETVRLPPAAIFSIKHRETFVLRDQVVPLTRLRRLLGMDELATERDAALATLVVKVHGENIGVVVDNFREGMEVILKPMEGVLGSLRQYAGTALLGDGSVMLVINIKELL
jgi:two-component system chemotaxis sensor kinase CheA